MGFFNRKKQEPPNEHAANMAQAAQKAVEYAHDFRVDFDYTDKSVEALEGVLDYYANDMRKAQPTERQVWTMASFFGAYLGELMLRNGLAEKGYEWGVDEQGGYPVLISDGNYTVAPIDKVFKRFVNGSEDNVVSFFTYGMKEFAGVHLDPRIGGTYSNLALLSGESVNPNEPHAWLFSNGYNGIVVEQQDGTNICVYATDASHQEVYCAVPLGFSDSLRGVPCAIFLRNNAPSKVTVYGNTVTVFIDFVNKKCSTNLGVNIIGSEAWGHDVALPWDDSMTQ